MAVYKEAMKLVGELKSMQKQIYDDAADYGIPILSKDDKAWSMVQSLVAQYFTEGDTREQHKWESCTTVKIKMRMIDEFGDGEKFWLVLEYTTVSGRISKTRWGNIIGILSIDDQDKW